MVSTSSFADTIILKNGDHLQGKVLRESDKEILIEEKLSRSITDERNLLKDDIAKIEKESQDEPAFQAIKNLKLSPNSLALATYDQVSRSLNSFIQKFPESSHLKEVNEQLALWQNERKRVEAGEVKFKGGWLSKEEAQKEQPQITGARIFDRMQQLYRQQDLVGALNTFDRLERTAPGASVYPDAVEFAKAILPSLKSVADRTLEQAKARDAEREKGVQLLSEPDRSQTLAAIQLEKKQTGAAAEAAMKANLKWPPLLNDENILTSIVSKVTDEQRRLSEIPISKLRYSIQFAEKARAQLVGKNFDQAEDLASQATELWTTNELAQRLGPEIAAQKYAATRVAPSENQPPGVSASAENSASTAESVSTETTQSPTSPSTQSAPGHQSFADDENSYDERKPPFFVSSTGVVVMIVTAILVLTVLNAFRKIAKRSAAVLE